MPRSEVATQTDFEAHVSEGYPMPFVRGLKMRYILYPLGLVLSFSLLTGGVLHFEADLCRFTNERFNEDSQMQFYLGQKRRGGGIPFVYSYRYVMNSDSAYVAFTDFEKNRYKRIEIKSIDIENTDKQKTRINARPLNGDMVRDQAGKGSFEATLPIELKRLGRVMNVIIEGWVEDDKKVRQPFLLTFPARYSHISETSLLWWSLP
jgi:hypothetical protein